MGPAGASARVVVQGVVEVRRGDADPQARSELSEAPEQRGGIGAAGKRDQQAITTTNSGPRLDWNIYARLDRLFLKMFLEEEDLSLVVAVDTSASMHWGNPSKFIFCQRLAMALGYIGLANHNRVTLYAFDSDEVRPLRNLRGRRRTQEMGAWLLDLEPGGRSDFHDAMRLIALGRQGKGVMVILSDFMFKEGYEKGLRYLAGGGYDTFCMQILSPEEIDPGKHGLAGDLRLTDVEDEDTAEITVSAALLKRYKENLDGYCGRLREFCARRGITHVTIDTSIDMDTLLLEYLRQRGLLR